jgi:hypothetical protein
LSKKLSPLVLLALIAGERLLDTNLEPERRWS